MSIPKKKLPGTSYDVQLEKKNGSGKISLIKLGKWPVVEKITPALDAKTVGTILNEVIKSEGLTLNPRIVSRIVGELLEELEVAPEPLQTPEPPEKPSQLIEMEETEVPPTTEMTVTTSESKEIPETAPLTSKSKSLEDHDLPEETFEHIQVLKIQIKELQDLVKTISEKFDALNIIVEKLDGQTN